MEREVGPCDEGSAVLLGMPSEIHRPRTLVVAGAQAILQQGMHAEVRDGTATETCGGETHAQGKDPLQQQTQLGKANVVLFASSSFCELFFV